MPKDNQETAAWDARQQFVKEIENLDEKANKFKLVLENRGSPDEIVKAFKVYFSTLRWLYRKIKHYVDNSDKKCVITKVKEENGKKKTVKEKMSMEDAVKNLRNRLNEFERNVSIGGMIRDRINIPVTLEDDIENFHQALNEVRHDKGLVMPTHSATRYSPEEAALMGMNE